MFCTSTPRRPFGASWNACAGVAKGTQARRRTVIAAGPRDVDVAVAGGGPAGCATAIALKRWCPELSVTVLERASALRPVGGALGIGATNGLAALHSIGSDVEGALQAAAMWRKAFEVGMTEDTLKRLEEKNFSASTMGMQVAWYDMQQTLKGFIDDNDYHVGSGVTTVVEQTDGSLLVGLANGSQVRCKMLVGADGNRSAVRSNFVAPTESLFYVGCCAWRFWLPEPWPNLPEKTARVLEKDGKTLSLVNLPRRNDEMAAFGTVFVPYPEERLGELNQTRYIQDVEDDAATLQARLDRMCDAVGDTFPHERIDFLCKHASAASTLEHPVWALDPHFPWSRGMAVLVGDSAHIMPAHMAQGTPMAFEDAVQLAASVAEYGLSRAALEHYEKARKPRVLPVWEAATDSAIQWYQRGDKTYSAFADLFYSSSTKKTVNPNLSGLLEIVDSYVPPPPPNLQS